MVEQNARRCLQICDRGYVLDQGRDAHTGTGRELANDPKVIELYLGTLAEDVEAEERGGRQAEGRPGQGRQAEGPGQGRRGGARDRVAAHTCRASSGSSDVSRR